MKNLKSFSLLIKPASADCNLRCEYCFYISRQSLYPETTHHRMGNLVLEKLISSYMATDQPQYTFGWQGGEPTLMGVDFFRRVTDLQQKYVRNGALVSNGLQTNATLLTDEFAAHLAKYRFLVGVSLDGPPELHDHFRVKIDGSNSHYRVLKGIECLQRHQVEFNVLVLVNSHNVRHAKEIYQYLCDMGVYYQQYIPCTEFDKDGRPLPYTITGAEWGQFLIELYQQWYSKDSRKVSIRLFDAIMNLMANGDYYLCHMAGNCQQYFVVEYNGDVYPCDFFVDSSKHLGNITSNTWETLLNHPGYQQFGSQKAAWNDLCVTCPFLRFCSGDCLKQRFYGGEDPQRLSWLCEGWRAFYNYALPGFEKLVLIYLKENRRSLRLFGGELGRNSLCYCGSGKKYKKCHGFGGVN